MVVVGEGECKEGMRERRAWKIGCCTRVVQVGREANLVEKGPFIYLFIFISIIFYLYLIIC